MNMLSCSLGLLKRYLAVLSYRSQVTWTDMSFLFAMPRPVAHGPTLKCANYLLCTSGRYLHRATGTRSAYCLSCGSSAMCKYTGCANHALPKVLAPSDSCIDHAFLQSCAQETLPWPRCANAISRGCQKPSKTDGGGFCFACEASNLPCLNASRGILLTRAPKGVVLLLVNRLIETPLAAPEPPTRYSHRYPATQPDRTTRASLWRSATS